MLFKRLGIVLIARISSNLIAQKALAWVVKAANYFQGIGSGSSVETSGELAVLNRLVANAVVFDVGANKGDFARMVLERVKEVKLHCFEPSAITYRRLTNELAGRAVTLNNFGLAEEEGQQILYTNENESGMASLSRRTIAYRSLTLDKEERVTLKTLSGYCMENSISRIDLLKIDVEGHEMGVLLGGGELLRSQSIRYVLFEFGGCNIDSRTYFRDFHELFTSSGAKGIWRITPSGWMMPIRQYREEMECFTTTNFFVSFQDEKPSH